MDGAERAGWWSLVFNPRLFGIGLLVFAGYYFGATVGFALTFRPHPVSVLWPPNAILLAALLLTPQRLWWLVIGAALPAHLAVEWQSDVPLTMMLCWFISNCCEALIGAGCVRYFLDGQVRFNRLRTVAIFCLGAALLAPFLSSFLDTAFVRLNHWGDGTYFEIWRMRFTSNVLAALTVAPVIVTWATADLRAWQSISPARLLEAVLLWLGLLAATLTGLNWLGTVADPALLFLPVPFLLWAAIRFGAGGASSAILLVSFLAIWASVHGHGPFSTESAEANARAIKIFLIVTSVPFLFLAALTEERNEAEETLREREQRIGLAAESANLALWTINYQRRESWMSAKGRDLFGFAPNEQLSREVFLSRVHPEDRAAVDDAIEQARAQSRSFEIEYRLLRPDGETRWLIARGRYLRDERGQVNELIGVAIDVTEQAQANLELRLQQVEMARLGRVAVLGELTASLAHELNQPLTAIASNAAAGRRFLARDAVEVEMLDEILADISTDARRAGEVIHGIRHLVSKNSGSRCRVDVNEIVREVLRLLYSDMVGRSITVETRLAANLPEVEADPVHLQQVLLNLTMNSLEAMQFAPSARRRVVISTRCGADSAVVTEVRDYGVGLPTGDPEKIFANFYSTKKDGMGMGLAIVRSIVETHGGELRGENCEVGARFSFRLPPAPAA